MLIDNDIPEKGFLNKKVRAFRVAKKCLNPVFGRAKIYIFKNGFRRVVSFAFLHLEFYGLRIL